MQFNVQQKDKLKPQPWTLTSLRPIASYGASIAPRGRKIEISGRQRWLSPWRVQSTWKGNTRRFLVWSGSYQVACPT